MRKLVVISRDLHIRGVVTSGALDAIEDSETYYVASRPGVRDPSALERMSGYLGTVEEPKERREPYARLKKLMLHSFADESRTIENKLAMGTRSPVRKRLRVRLGRSRPVRVDLGLDLAIDEALWHRFATLPPVRRGLIRRYVRQAGVNPGLHRIMEGLRPDLVIVPSNGVEMLPHDAIVSARRVGAASLALVVNWDNLSSKGAFAVKPDYMAVWGEQSAEHAERIHGFPRERVAPIGVPTFDSYFRHEPGSTESPFPFRYVLFAGCAAEFDEAAALRRLDRLITEHDLDLKVVYRPHPYRRPRERPDFVDESAYANVVIDPQVRDAYVERAGEAQRSVPIFPALDYYPALLENAAFVVCPLSTMIVESAIFERRVVVIAYHDGIHENSPATRIDMDHFEGMDRVEGFDVARTEQDLDRAFLSLARDASPPARALRDQIGWWLHHDGRSYAERLAELVERIGRERGLPSPLRFESPASPHDADIAVGDDALASAHARS